MGRLLGFTLALFGLVTLAACGDGSATGLATGGSGTTAITVSSGTTPSISWTGGNARRLTITQASGGGVFWDIEALNSTGFAAPVVHGVVPNQARENNADAALVGGTDYRVNVTLVNGTEGTRVFRP
jgi:hypothetical protein